MDDARETRRLGADVEAAAANPALQLPPRRKKVSYEVFDDEDADGGPTPVPYHINHAAASAAADQAHPRKRQRREHVAHAIEEVDEEDDEVQLIDGEGDEEAAAAAAAARDERKRQRKIERRLERERRRQEMQQNGGGNRSSLEAEERPHQLLPVADLPRDFDGAPDSGATYLAMVRREAQRAPHFTRAHNPYDRGNPSSLSKTNKSGGGDQNAARPSEQQGKSGSFFQGQPVEHWRNYQLSRFRGMRNCILTYAVPSAAARAAASVKIESSNSASFESSETDPSAAPAAAATAPLRIPDPNDREGWFYFVHRRPAPRGILQLPEDRPTTNADGVLESDQPDFFNIDTFVQAGLIPTPALLRRFSQDQVRALIKLLSDIIPRFAHVAQNPDFNSPYTASRKVINPLHARWLFSLLIVLDSHLTSDQLNELRNTARTIIFNMTLDRYLLLNDLRSLEQMKACHEAAQQRRERRRADNAAGGAEDDNGGGGGGGGEEEDEEDPGWTEENEKMYQLCRCERHHIQRESSAWILITYIAGFWGQHDLLEEAEASVKRAEAMLS
ncbi:hypothetical protein OC834_001396 [Tilletia horrida]|nr:hypothetical protein OC834_001396 [Tilletia horrida]